MPAPIVSITSPQSTLSVDVDPSVLLPSEFIVRRGYEGPQVIIEWNAPLAPASVVAFRLVRRLFGFPANETDGLILFDGAPIANVISDVDVEACKCYYYKLFSFAVLGEIFSLTSSQGFVIPVTTGFFAERTFEILPEAFKVGDKGQDIETEIKRALVEGPFSGTYPEVFNFGEDGSVAKGPLRRLLKVLGPMFDEPKGLLDCLLQQLDVDEACLPNLDHLAALLGLSLNKELTPEKFRNEARLQVEFLKIKGTIPGVEARLRSVSGITPIVVEQCNNVFFTNDLTCTTLAFDPVSLGNFGGPGDVVCYLAGFPDITPFWLWFTVFIDITNVAVDEATQRKWCLSLDEASPACHRGFLRLFDLYEETIIAGMVDEFDDLEVFSEPVFPIDIADEFSDSQSSDPSTWMIISDPTKTIGTADYTAVFAAPTLP